MCVTESVLSAVIGTEKKAQAAVMKAKKRQEEFETELEKEKQLLFEQLTKKFHNRLSAAEEEQNALREKELESLAEQFERQFSEMRQKSTADFDKWVDMLYRRITDGEGNA